MVLVSFTSVKGSDSNVTCSGKRVIIIMQTERDF